MMKLKENASLLIVNMKKLGTLIMLLFLVSCTSNTIFKKPKNLIPKDTMSLLIQDMMIASSAKHVKNKKMQKSITYMAFVYDKYKIDSLRFKKSNLYYLSEIDLYVEIFEDAKTQLTKKKTYFTKKSKELDSIKRDSIKKSNIKIKKLDSLKHKIVKEKV